MAETRHWEIVGSRVSGVEKLAACLLIVCRYGCMQVETTAASHAAVQELYLEDHQELTKNTLSVVTYRQIGCSLKLAPGGKEVWSAIAVRTVAGNAQRASTKPGQG